MKSNDFTKKAEVYRADGRIIYIDILKGTAIFLVVLGHIVTYDEDFYWLYQFIYSFHMPLFIFLSGCTTGLSYRRGTGTDAAYLQKRAVNIMVPYFAWALILPVIFTKPFGTVNWHSIIARTFVTNRMFWFLPTLYGLIFAYICYRRVGECFRHRWMKFGGNDKIMILLDCISCVIVVGLIVVLMQLTGYQLLRDVVGFTIPFFAAVMYIEHKWFYGLLFSRLSFAVALIIFALMIGRFDFDRISVMTSLLRMLLGMCAVVILLQLSARLKIPRIITEQLILWGRHSLLIYILHIQLMRNSGLLEVHFSSRICTLFWYCFVSTVTCCACSVFAIILERIPIARTVLLGKRGDCYAEKR